MKKLIVLFGLSLMILISCENEYPYFDINPDISIFFIHNPSVTMFNDLEVLFEIDFGLSTNIEEFNSKNIGTYYDIEVAVYYNVYDRFGDYVKSGESVRVINDVNTEGIQHSITCEVSEIGPIRFISVSNSLTVVPVSVRYFGTIGIREVKNSILFGVEFGDFITKKEFDKLLYF